MLELDIAGGGADDTPAWLLDAERSIAAYPSPPLAPASLVRMAAPTEAAEPTPAARRATLDSRGGEILHTQIGNAQPVADELIGERGLERARTCQHSLLEGTHRRRRVNRRNRSRQTVKVDR